MLEFAWIEGTRTFDICLGTAGAAVLPRHRVRLFWPRVDRGQGAQIADGLVCAVLIGVAQTPGLASQ